MVTKIFTFIISTLFLYSGISKALDLQAFYEATLNFKLGSKQLLALGVTVLPYLEIVTALGLLLSKLRLSAAILILCQYIIFQIWLGQAWVRGLIQDCPCFGNQGLDIRIEFGINFIFMAMTIFLIKEELRKQRLN